MFSASHPPGPATSVTMIPNPQAIPTHDCLQLFLHYCPLSAFMESFGIRRIVSDPRHFRFPLHKMLFVV